LELAATWLTASPYLAYTASESPLLGLDSTTETAQLRLTWSPPWRGSLLALEVGTDWSRTREAALPDQSATRYTAALTVGWGAGGQVGQPFPGEQATDPVSLLQARTGRWPSVPAPRPTHTTTTTASWR
jgi:hypothetical protein